MVSLSELTLSPPLRPLEFSNVCRAFAEALVAGDHQPSDCTVMSADDIEAVAGFLGVDAGEANKRVARLLCAGGSDVAALDAALASVPDWIAERLS